MGESPSSRHEAVKQLHANGADLALEASRCLARAADYSWSIAKQDGHWIGEVRSNVTVTAEQVFFRQALASDDPDPDAYRVFLLSQQQHDGSWAIAPQNPGDVSASSEAYLALRLLGLSSDAPEMRRARAFIRQSGGVAKVRILTRIFFAQFGLFPWDAVPQLPAEFILLPSACPVNIYRLSSWARSTIVPLLVIRHHEPIYQLPNGRSDANDFIDELWLDPSDKMVPYSEPVLGSDVFSLLFHALDRIIYWLGGLRWQPFRPHALRRCVDWILERQEEQGDWAGIIPPMHTGIQALLLQGYTLRDDAVRRGIEAIDRFTLEDESGKRLQPCVSPVWDTVLMTRSLCDAGVPPTHQRMQRAVAWIESRQLLGPQGDWRVGSPRLLAGGFSFEYHNTWYPDVDDTAAAILALVSQDCNAVGSPVVYRAAVWICGMQNKDGGWGAFDLDNDALWLNRIPFSDMDALCDPSSADVTGRVLEAFGLMLRLRLSTTAHMYFQMLGRISNACDRAVHYLAATQESTGAWYGRWGCNYIYGTSNVVCGLSYFCKENDVVQGLMKTATEWLKQAQNPDGGWGEDVESYRNAALAGKGPSTPSQTAWGLMGILNTCRVDDEAVVLAVSYLTSRQAPQQHLGWTWAETRYTGTGFPNFFYLGYALYSHYFPIMALGRFLSKSRQ